MYLMFRIEKESNTLDQGEMIGKNTIEEENTGVVGRGRNGIRDREETVEKKEDIEFRRRVVK